MPLIYATSHTALLDVATLTHTLFAYLSELQSFLLQEPSSHLDGRDNGTETRIAWQNQTRMITATRGDARDFAAVSFAQLIPSTWPDVAKKEMKARSAENLICTVQYGTMCAGPIGPVASRAPESSSESLCLHSNSASKLHGWRYNIGLRNRLRRSNCLRPGHATPL